VLVTAALTALVAGVSIVLAWHAHLPLIAFAGLLAALLLDGAARGVQHVLPAPRGLAVALVVLLGLGLAALAGWWFGPRLAGQAGDLIDRLPDALSRLEGELANLVRRLDIEELENGGANGWDQSRVTELLQGAWSSMAGAFQTGLAVASGVLVVAFLGLFFALDSQPYVRGALHLVPPRGRERAREVLDAIANALRWWLLGRLASMAIVGVLTALGLWILGVPLALLLGVLAALLAFIPFFGPIASVVPAVLIGLGESPRLALWVLVLYGSIQVLESNVVTPLIQSRAVALPPAVLILSQLVLGGLFGLLGVLVATPLVVATIVSVQLLYVEDALDDSVTPLGARNEDT